jgi:hypothetical protein
MQKIAIHSVPRSGSTWLGEILNSSPDVKYYFQPLFSYKFKDFLDESSLKEEVDRFYSMLNDTDDVFVCQQSQREAGTLPCVKKSDLTTHVVYKEVRYHHILENLLRVDEDIKLILLVRDPIEVMNSWINAPKEFDKNWDAEKELVTAELKNEGRKENFYGLDAWVQTTRLFEHLAKRYNKRVLLINYSILKSSPLHTVESILEFCDLELTDTTYSFLSESSEKKVSDTYSVFRGGKGSRITLDDNLVNKITTYVSDAKLAYYINTQINE